MLLLLLPIVAASSAGCAAEVAESDVMAGAACVGFAEVYVATAEGKMDPLEGMERIRDARDLAAEAAGLDRRYQDLADDLAAMYAAMGASDAALSEALANVHGSCDPLLQ
jgi:hypothetical protein